MVRGSTVLFTVAHVHNYFRWDNIAHFARELIPLANLLHESGAHLGQNALVWEASQEKFTGNGSGFTTDWYVQSLASELEHGASGLYTCEQVPFASGAEGGLCFEKLVAFPEPQGIDPPTFSDRSVCTHFQSRVYQRFGLSQLPVSSVVRSGLVLIRTDNQGWSNSNQAASEIRSYFEGVGGRTNTVFLNQSSMTLREQVSWFMNAGVVVTTHGAHEMNLLFSRPDSILVEYFKKNHWSFAFSKVALSCGLRYIAVHSKDTDFSSKTRRYLNKARPLDFRVELQPVLKLAMGKATDGVQDYSDCPFLIRTVSKGWKCAASVAEAKMIYRHFISQAPSNEHVSLHH